MKLDHNQADPHILFFDANSSFASCEKQANHLIRNKPVAVCAGVSDRNAIISPCYLSKSLGLKVGDRIGDAKRLVPNLVVLPPDYPKYRAVHMKLNRLFREYTPNVRALSIDECAMDMRGTTAMSTGLEKTAQEIKKRIKAEIGDFLTYSVGIGTSIWMGKTASNLQKPDGLTEINYRNIHEVLERMQLEDLNGINHRFGARLRSAGILTPLDFYNAPMMKLKKQVFQSVVGIQWYMKLKGFETNFKEFDRHSFGNSYTLHKFTTDVNILAPMLYKLCEKTGRRLRRHSMYSHGIHLGIVCNKNSYWHKGRKITEKLYSTGDIYKHIMRLFGQAQLVEPVSHLMITVFDLHNMDSVQLELNDEVRQRKVSLSTAMDTINDKWGEFTAMSALMMGTDEIAIDRISFGGMKELVDLYN